jgi:hypothetical protein
MKPRIVNFYAAQEASRFTIVPSRFQTMAAVQHDREGTETYDG